MVKKITLLLFCVFLFSYFADAQCDAPGSLPTPDCADAPYTCLEGACWSTGTQSGGDPHIDFCGPGTGLQNPQYFKFIALCDQVCFTFTVSGCAGSLQIAIIDMPEPCAGWGNGDVLFCFNGLIGTGDVCASGLIPGNTYYLLIDGFSGAQCQYIIDMINDDPSGNNCIEDDFPIGTISPPISGPDVVCPGGRATFSIPEVDEANTYKWTINGGNAVVTLTPEGELTFPNNLPDGTVLQVCVRAYNGCDSTDQICKDVTIQNLPVTILPDTIVCKKEIPLPYKFYNWNTKKQDQKPLSKGFNEIKIPSSNGCDSTLQINVIAYEDITPETFLPDTLICAEQMPFSYSFYNWTTKKQDKKSLAEGYNKLTIPSYRGCDSILNINLVFLDNPEPPQKDTAICYQRGIEQYTHYDNYGGGVTSKKYFPNPPNQPYDVRLKTNRYPYCDSMIKLNILGIKVTPTINKTGELSCTNPSQYIYLDASEGSYTTIEPVGYFGIADVTYEWYDPKGNRIPDQYPNPAALIVGGPNHYDAPKDVIEGWYKLKICATLYGATCCVTDSVKVEKKAEGFPDPIVDGDLQLCSGENTTLTVTTDDPLITIFEWTLPSGVKLVRYEGTKNNVAVVQVTAGADVKICVSAKSNCGAKDTCFNVKVNPLPTATIVANPDSLCLGESSELTINLTGTGPDYDVTLSDGVNADTLLKGITTGHKYTVTPTSTTTYKITNITDNGGNRCANTSTASVTVNVSVPQGASVEPHVILCNFPDPKGVKPTTINLDSMVNSGVGTWATDPNGTTPWSGTFPNNMDFSGVDYNTYYFTYTVTNPRPCADSVYQVGVQVVNCKCPIVSLESRILCNDDAIVVLDSLLLTDTITGTWSVINNGTTPPSIITGNEVNATGTSGLIIASYKLNESPPEGCIDTTQTFIKVIAPPVAVLQDTTVCNAVPPSGNGSPILNLNNLVKSGDKTGTWTNVTLPPSVKGTFPNALDFTGLTNEVGQTYQVKYTIKGTAPCADEEYTINITIKDCNCPNAQTNPPVDTLCNVGGKLDLTTLLQGAPVPTQPGTWSITGNPGGAGPFAKLNGGKEFDADGATGGTYEVTYTLTEQIAGCVVTSKQKIEVMRTPVSGVSEPEAVVCYNAVETIQLSDLLTNEDAGGVWTETSSTPSTGGAFSTATGTFATVGQAVGIYKFRYTVSGRGICNDASTEVTVRVKALPIADAGTDKTITCAVPKVTIGGPNTTTTGVSYSWELNKTPLATTKDYETSESGDWVLIVTDNVDQCQSSDTVKVTVDGNPVRGFESILTHARCNGECNGTIEIKTTNIEGGQAPYTIVVDGQTYKGDALQTGKCKGDYVVTITDGNGCVYSNTVTITEPPKLTVNLGEDQLIDKGKTATIVPTYNLPVDSVASVVVTDGSGEICNLKDDCANITVNPTSPTTYVITVTNKNGCTATDELTINIRLRKQIFVPNAFSPNDDANNDRLLVYGNEEVEKVKAFRVFNRWGDLVYEELDVKLDDMLGWDGHYKSKLCNPAVYVYVVDILFRDKKEKRYKGDVTIMSK